MLYLEDYVELIEHLPVDLRERFTDMKEMDSQVQSTVDALNGRVKSLFRECAAKKGKVENADEIFENIRSSYRKALDDADEKVQLAGQIYDLVDRHLRKLDQELAKFKMELEADNGGITEILEQRSLELDNPMPHSSHSLGRRHAHGGLVSSQSSAALPAVETENGPVDKRLKIEGIPDVWNHSESAPPSVMSSDIIGTTSGFESDRSGSRPPSRSSVTGSRQAVAPTIEIPSSNPQSAAETPTVRGMMSLKSGQDVVKLQESFIKVEGHPFSNDVLPGIRSQNSVHEDLIDEDSSQSSQDVMMTSPSGLGSRPSRTKKQTSRAAAWTQERMQAEARRGQAREREHSTSFMNTSNVELAESGTSADWAIDPQEPRYCLCNQLSYGEMVACDNNKCAIEWFHYGCVGLTEAPKGKWYCPQCTQSMKRRNKNRQ